MVSRGCLAEVFGRVGWHGWLARGGREEWLARVVGRDGCPGVVVMNV